jgi:hypothetical protein
MQGRCKAKMHLFDPSILPEYKNKWRFISKPRYIKDQYKNQKQLIGKAR